MNLITKVDISSSDNGNYAKIVMDPLNKGYGATLGNSIRRVLLSSLDGAAITAVKIDGILHEFDTIEGVKEDIMDVILNIKKIILKSYSDEPKKIVLEANGKGDLLVSDIKHDADIEIINKDLKLATITSDKVKLKIELRVEKGVGYRLSESNEYEDMPEGTILVDSSFTPVLKVNHVVSDTRVGNRTDLDKLVLEVWTNGSISAEQALEDSSKILIDSFSLFTDYKHIITQPVVDELDDVKPQTQVELDLTIEDLELSARSSNCLRKAGIEKVSDLVEKPMKELINIKNFGRKSADEINLKLTQYSLKLKDD